MNSKEIIEMMSQQIKLLLAALGPEVPDFMKSHRDENGNSFQEEWKEFYIDITAGGDDGFCKHYDVTTMSGVGDPDSNIEGVAGIGARTKVGAAVLETLAKIFEEMGNAKVLKTADLMKNHEPEELTPEQRRDIEFNL